jgi:hypothetical protein
MSQLEASAGIPPELAASRARARRASKARNKIADGFCELVEDASLEEACDWLRKLLDGDGVKAS